MTKKNVLVTGVSRGIGQGICRHLVAVGFHVHGTFNTGVVEAQQLKGELKDDLTLHQVDLADRKSTRALILEMSKLDLHAIVNNAGMIEFEEFDEFDFENWDRTLEVNVTAPLLIAQGLGKIMAPGSAIVNIASTDGMTGTFASVAYAASKAALLNVTKSLGNILGSKGVRVVAIAPGWINTGMSTTASMEAVALTPLGRNGRPEDIASVVEFLISDAARFVTGAALVVDGGYTNVDSIMMREAKGEI